MCSDDKCYCKRAAQRSYACCLSEKVGERRENRKAEVTTVSELVGVGVLP